MNSSIILWHYKQLDKVEIKMKQNIIKFNSVRLCIVMKINNALNLKLH